MKPRPLLLFPPNAFRPNTGEGTAEGTEDACQRYDDFGPFHILTPRTSSSTTDAAQSLQNGLYAAWGALGARVPAGPPQRPQRDPRLSVQPLAPAPWLLGQSWPA